MNTTNTSTPKSQSAWQRFVSSLSRLFGRKKSPYGDWLNETNGGNANGRNNPTDDFMNANNVDGGTRV
jgi:hypothetical protein